uniref:Uncharacterized protein n=1 Tax=Strigamia maritima TaxID=126957 RepID=T1IWT6_STRMM
MVTVKTMTEPKRIRVAESETQKTEKMEIGPNAHLQKKRAMARDSRTFSAWQGRIRIKIADDNDNYLVIDKVRLLSHGIKFKTIGLGSTFTLTSTLTGIELKESYLKNTSKLSIEQEFYNGQFYLSYFQMLCEDDSPIFDQLYSYLETTGNVAIWYCGNRVDGLLVCPKSKYLDINIQHLNKSLHCLFAAQHSLESQLTLARDKFLCVKSPLETMKVTDKDSVTLNVATIASAFQKQAIDLQIRHPEMIVPTALTVISDLPEPLSERHLKAPKPAQISAIAKLKQQPTNEIKDDCFEAIKTMKGKIVRFFCKVCETYCYVKKEHLEGRAHKERQKFEKES